jgi:hypothetical protein
MNLIEFKTTNILGINKSFKQSINNCKLEVIWPLNSDVRTSMAKKGKLTIEHDT